MKFLVAAGAILILGTATPVQSSSVVLGKGPARACYEAALNRQSSDSALDSCTTAFGHDLAFADLVATHVNRGIVHSLRKDTSSALRDYDAAIALDPAQPEAFLNKAVLMLRVEGREKEVVQLANAALSKQTKNPALAYYVRAIAHEETGNVADAYRDYRSAAQLAPEWELPAQDLERFSVRS